MAKKICLLKRIILTVVLYAVYVAFYEAMTGLDDVIKSEFFYVKMLLCTCMAVIITPIYYFVSIRILKLEFKRIRDYIPGIVVFLLADVLFCVFYMYYESVKDPSPFSGLGSVLIFFDCLSMYLIGNCAYALSSYLIYNIRNKMYGDILKKVVSAILALLLYSPFVFYVLWMERVEVSNIYRLIPYGFIFIDLVVTAIFHLICRKGLKVSSEKIKDHVVLLSFFVCVATVLYFSLYFIINDEYFGFYLEKVTNRYIHKYIKANVIYFLIKKIFCSFKKKKDEEVYGCSEEKEGREEGKNGSVSAWNSGDC